MPLKKKWHQKNLLKKGGFLCCQSLGLKSKTHHYRRELTKKRCVYLSY